MFKQKIIFSICILFLYRCDNKNCTPIEYSSEHINNFINLSKLLEKDNKVRSYINETKNKLIPSFYYSSLPKQRIKDVDFLKEDLEKIQLYLDTLSDYGYQLEIKFGNNGEILFVTDKCIQQVDGQGIAFYNCLIYNYGKNVKVHFGNPKIIDNKRISDEITLVYFSTQIGH